MATAFSKFTTLRVKLDVKTKTERGMDEVTSASSGKTITFTKSFSDIRNVEVSAARDDTNQAIAVYDFVDAPNPTSMTVYIYATKGASAGTKITGNFSWSVEGV